MSEMAENRWLWYQASGKAFRVISDAKKGYIRVYNEAGTLIMEKTHLTKDQVKIIEHNFLCHVSKKARVSSRLSTNDTYDPMVA
jgi:hypothetical protein